MVASSSYEKTGYPFSILVVALLALAVMLLLLHRDYQRFIEDRDHLVQDHARYVRFETDRYFQRYQLLVTGIAQSPCFKERNVDLCNRLLQDLNRNLPDIENFAATDRDGRFFASGRPFDRDNPPAAGHLPFYQQLKDGAGVAVMEAHTGPISGQPVTGLAIPLLNQSGSFDGALGVSVLLAEIEQIWGKLLNDRQVRLFIFDNTRRLLASSESAKSLLQRGLLDPERLGAALATGADPLWIDDFRLFCEKSTPGNWSIVVLRAADADIFGYLWERRINAVLGAGFVLLLVSLLLLLQREAGAKARLSHAEQQLQLSRRELEALSALEQSELRYRELFQKAPVGLWEEDFTEALKLVKQLQDEGVDDLLAYFEAHPDKLREVAARVRIIDVNTAALALHGATSRDELLGALKQIFNDNSYQLFGQEIAALAAGEESFRFEGEVCTLDGRRLLVAGGAYRLHDRDDSSRMLIATNDITEQRNIEAALRRSQKMEAIGKISGGIAHDFNNILGIIIGNLDLLKLGAAGDSKQLKRVAAALQAALRAAELTRQLLGFSRLHAQQEESADLNEVIAGMESLVERSLTPAISVSYRLQDDLWPVSINIGDCKDALLNLIINARDSIAESGSIELKTENVTLTSEHVCSRLGLDPGDYVRLRISDTGQGIAPEDIEHLFEPFFTTKPQGAGTGLGLSMVFGFVSRSAGGIDVESTPGRGSIFSLLLPRTQPANVRRQGKDADPGDLRLEGMTVLAVDDEPQLLELAQTYLRSWGLRVVTATSGQEALQLLSQMAAPDILFTDIVMPGGIGGYELAKRVLESHPQTRVLFTSGYADKDQLRAQDAPSPQLLSKPYTRKQLERKLRQILFA